MTSMYVVLLLGRATLHGRKVQSSKAGEPAYLARLNLNQMNLNVNIQSPMPFVKSRLDTRRVRIPASTAPNFSLLPMPSKTSILYWKEIPVQIKAENDETTLSVPLDPRFQEAADAVAMMDGSYGSDEYLDAWQWGPTTESDFNNLDQAANALAQRINNGMPQDFVARIRDMHNAGNRDATPGSIDHWVE